MGEALILLATSFWYGALHAIQPGHGKTIAAAYIVGARGRPVDAVVLGIFVTLSHTSGIVAVGVVASLGLPGLIPQRIEAWLAVVTGVLVILIGLWALWTQRAMFQVAGWGPARYRPVLQGERLRAGLDAPAGAAQAHAADHSHAHDHAPHYHAPHHPGHRHHEHGPHAHTHEHAAHTHGADEGYHSHGWGLKHTHDVALVTTNRPSMWMLIWLGIAGGLLPDPLALTLLLRALAEGKVMLGLGVVLVFSLGFAAVLVLVGIVAAAVGRKVLDWLAGPWAARLQIITSVVIVIVGVVLTALAVVKLGAAA
jgi:nickel/cobalt transporter (NicO) family protein